MGFKCEGCDAAKEQPSKCENCGTDMKCEGCSGANCSCSAPADGVKVEDQKNAEAPEASAE